MPCQTIRDYYARNTLPAPKAHAGGSPLWARRVIDQWYHHRPEPGRPRRDWQDPRHSCPPGWLGLGKATT
jgi:hypothetical protein